MAATTKDSPKYKKNVDQRFQQAKRRPSILLKHVSDPTRLRSS